MIVKICGIMSTEAALAAKECGADLVGFVFAAGRRRMEPAAVRKIAADIKGIGKAGVFVNAPLSEVIEIARQCCLDYVQLHGDEPLEYCQALQLPVIKAFRWQAGILPDQINSYPADWLLLDSSLGAQFGGTGKPFNWTEASSVREAISKPFMLAGGLSPGNVTEAVRTLKPDGIDVSSGVETNGIKDAEKIAAFLAAVRDAEGGGKHA